MVKNFVCPICGNSDPKYIGLNGSTFYCRRCIQFKVKEEIENDAYPKKAKINLNYELSDEQRFLSNKLIENYKRGIDSLVHAVCGSGKTEISLGVIQYAIECGEKVAFAVPRRDVVIELHNRLKEIFKKNDVIAVYGGHTEITNGDIIVCTTHQLFRYRHFFSLIILDEIDAFPFKGDEVLRSIFFRALCGHYIMMSATPTKEALDLFKGDNKDILRLDIRFHRHPLPTPNIVVFPFLGKYVFLIKTLKRFMSFGKQVFVFCPTIRNAEISFKILRKFFPNGAVVHSKNPLRKQIIEDFRDEKYSYLVTTSILERGVTVRGLQVIVFNADSKIYDSGTLVQIAGRAGRKRDAPDGEVIFIGKTNTEDMKNAVKSIQRSNKALQDMF